MQPILVIEDDAQLRQVVRLVLDDEGRPVEGARDGQQALERISCGRPSLVVLDWSLSDTDGAVVGAALRATHGEGIPILLMTADGRAADKARRFGAFAYLHKPFDLDDLVDHIRRGLGQS